MATNFAATYITRLEDETRERLDTAAREQSELDPRSVLMTLQQWIANGEVERARAFVATWKASN